MNIRDSVPGDARAVGDLLIELGDHHFELQPHNPRYGVKSERWHEIARQAVTDPDGEVLIAEGEGTVVGCSVLRYEDKPWGLACQVETLIVTAGWRGRGVGKALLAAGEVAAARRGALGMRVEVVVENDEAQAFYAARGYRPLALRLGKPVEGRNTPPP
jgi:ribosomal protein S18 acetylase RimI-like enzyme